MQGCILNLKFIFLPPPPLFFFWLIYLPQMFNIRRGYAPQAKNVQPCFAILKILNKLGKIMHTFYQSGEKYAFFPLFSSPFNNLFPQHVIWPFFCPPPPAGGEVKQKNIHPWNNVETLFFFLINSVTKIKS